MLAAHSFLLLLEMLALLSTHTHSVLQMLERLRLNFQGKTSLAGISELTRT